MTCEPASLGGCGPSDEEWLEGAEPPPGDAESPGAEPPPADADEEIPARGPGGGVEPRPPTVDVDAWLPPPDVTE